MGLRRQTTCALLVIRFLFSKRACNLNKNKRMWKVITKRKIKSLSANFLKFRSLERTANRLSKRKFKKIKKDVSIVERKLAIMDLSASVHLFFVESTDTQKSTNVTMTSKENSAKDLKSKIPSLNPKNSTEFDWICFSFCLLLTQISHLVIYIC